MPEPGWIRLDQLVGYDIEELRRNIPNINISFDNFLSLVLQCAATVKIPSIGFKESKQLSQLMKTRWLLWKRRMYIWLGLKGVFPWYFVEIKGTPHKYPVAPPWGSGYIETRMNKKHIQEFQWKWNDSTGKADKKMIFETKLHPPTIFGEFTVPLRSLVEQYRTLRIARESREIALYNQARPQHVIEYAPNTAQFKDDITQAEVINSATRMMNQGNNRSGGSGMIATRKTPRGVGSINIQRNVRVEDAKREVQRASKKNKFLGSQNDMVYMHSPQTTPEAATFENRTIHLRADMKYKPIPNMKIDVSLRDLTEQLNKEAALIMDFPVTLLSAISKTSAQATNNLRFVNERVKDWINYFECRTKNALILCYKESVGSLLKKQTKDDSFTLEDKMTVELPCTPLGTFEELYQYVETGIMSLEDFAPHAYRLKALPFKGIPKQSVEPEMKKRKTMSEEKPKKKVEKKPEKKPEKKVEKKQKIDK